MPTYLLAHDLGTTGDKATLFSAEGDLIGSITAPYPLQVNGSCAEQDPEDWWKAVVTTTRTLTERVNPAKIAAVSFSGQMMGCLCVDKEGRPLRPSILWADIRAEKEAALARRTLDDLTYYRLCGHRLSPSYSAAKLSWVKLHEPQVYEKTYKMLNAKDYILLKLTGRFVTEVSDASSTCLMDINTLTWSEALLAAHGLSADKMPDLLRSVDMAGKVTKEAAAITGLPEGTPVICGGGDGPAAAVGSGAIAPGVANLCLGTSSWISFAADEPLFDPDMTTFTFAHMVPGKLLPTGTMQCGGGSLSWAVRELFRDSGCPPHEIYNTVNREVEACAPGADGLLFLPYLMGERSPRWNSEARGCFIGLTLGQERGQMLRAVMEGVAMNLDIIRNAFVQGGADIRSLTLLGGGARNPAWQTILANVLNTPVKVPALLNEATSMGAAVTAGVGVGLYDSFDAIHRFLTVAATRYPEPSAASFYETGKRRFEEAYQALTGLFHSLAEDRSHRI